MARFRRMDVLTQIGSSGLVPIFYSASAEVAFRVAAACADGGSRILEFTNRGDRAHLVFQQLIERCEKERPELILGVGTICDPHTAALYMNLGANFIVTPSFDAEVVRMANRRKVPCVPGCGSATEIASAEELGCEIVKLFPADALGGVKFLNAILGPAPWTSLMPAGGVDYTEESVRGWIESGAACIGMGQKLIAPDAVKAGNYEDITTRAKAVLGWIRAARAKEKRS